MKKILIIISLIGLFFIACKKDGKKPESTAPANTPNTSIIYPDSVYYGKNVLAVPDSTVLDTTQTYSFGAILGTDASLKIRLTRLAPPIQGMIPPIWSFEANPSWWLVQNDPSGGDSIQTFTALAKGEIDLKVFFSAYWQDGRAKMEFFENSTSVTRVKYLSW